jgi:pre-mRNA-splicing factor ATP-dependent RNA helicase DHX16
MSIFQGSKNKEKSGLDELEEVLAEEEKDIRERDALASRIQERDRKNKRHIVSKSESLAQIEAAKRLKLSVDIGSNHPEVMKKLREESRRKYLPKRKDDKLYEIRRQLQDDEIYFPEAEVTERERAERQRKREILELAEKYEQAGSLLKTQRYVIRFYFNNSV